MKDVAVIFLGLFEVAQDSVAERSKIPEIYKMSLSPIFDIYVIQL